MQMPGAARHEVNVAQEPVEAPAAAPEPVGNSNRGLEEEGFFSDTARRAMQETFARLDTEHEEKPPALAVETPAPEGSSVQAVFEHAVRDKFGSIAAVYLRDHADEIVERMKPIVREWMDEHFPAILEGAVRNEVERAIRASAAYKPPRR
jgi:cell pole-organizing protein PopZ